MNIHALSVRVDPRPLPQSTPQSSGYIGLNSSSRHETDHNASRLAATFRHFWWVALLIWAVIAIPASIAIYQSIQPEFVATGTINIAPVVINPMSAEEKASPFYTEFLRSQADLMKNPFILQEAAKQPQMANFDWFRKLPDQVGYLQKAVEIDPVPNTENIFLSVNHPDAAAAKAIVDSVMDAYMRISTQQEESRNEKSLEILKRAQAATEQSLKDGQTQLTKLQAEGDMLGSESSRGILTDVLASGRQTLAKLETEQFNLQMQLDILKNKTPPDKDLYLASINLDADPQVDMWAKEKIRVQQLDNIAESDHLGDQHPVRVGYRNQITTLAANIAGRKQEILGSAWTSYQAGFELERARKIQDTQNDLDAGTKQIALLKDRLDSQQTAARELGAKQIPIAALRDQIADAKDSLKRYNDRIDEVTKQNQAPGRISAVATIQPKTATVDRRPKLALAANGLGVLAGVLALVLLMKLRDRIEYAEDLPTTFQPLVVGTVSHAGAAARRLQGRMNRKVLGEEMRLLHANLLPPGRPERRIMMVTSPTPANGKTSIASQLALSLAKSGMEVLLIDADLRKRDLFTMFDVGMRPGLSDLLQGRPPELIRPVELLPNLRLMGAGSKLDRNPVELFQRRHFHEALNLLQDKFDCIVVDTPPALIVADARLIAQSCDEVLCVVRAQVSSSKDVNQTIDALSRITGKTPKIILNGVAHRQSYYKYKFAYATNEDQSDPGNAVTDTFNA